MAKLDVPGLHEGWQVLITDEQKIWLANTGSKDATAGPGELFGFNTGAFQEKPLGLVGSLKTAIGFILRSDLDAVIHLRESGKTLCSLTQLAHWLASAEGFTEMSVVDHTITATVGEARGGFQLLIVFVVMKGSEGSVEGLQRFGLLVNGDMFSGSAHLACRMACQSPSGTALSRRARSTFSSQPR